MRDIMANENGKLQQEPETEVETSSYPSKKGVCLRQNEAMQLEATASTSIPVQTDCDETRNSATDSMHKESEQMDYINASTIEKSQPQQLLDDNSCLATSKRATTTTTTAGEILTSVTSTITSQIESSSSLALANNCARGQLTDLVADVCFNGAHPNCDSSAAITLPVGFGDCTNIRATVGVLDFTEGFSNRRTESHIENNFATASSSNNPNHINSLQQPSVSPTMHIPAATATATAPTQNASTFSFKHFLSSSNCAFTAPSTTVTSLDPICSVAAATAAVASTSPFTTVTMTTSTHNGSSSTQNSMGARPKVPQSVSDGGDTTNATANSSNIGGSTRMKRSPRFSSFDSQASLAEYAASGRNNNGNGDDFSLFSGTTSNSTGFRLYPDCTGSITKRNFNSNTATGFPSATLGQGSTIDGTESHCSGIVGDRQRHHQQQQQQQHQQQQQKQQKYVPRSYSNYDMPLSPSPRRRMAVDVDPDTDTDVAVCSTATTSSELEVAAAPIPNRPNRLSLHPLNSSTNSSKLKLDLPIDSAAANVHAPSDFPTISAAALPDFVQDHWMDALYLHDMHLSSPRSSPTRDFATASVWCNIGAGAVGGVSSSDSTHNPLDGPSTSSAAAAASTITGATAAGSMAPPPPPLPLPPTTTTTATTTTSNQINHHPGQVISENNAATGTGTANNGPNSNGGASKMLPDFLSDGPIIHSSQRLADIAAGLPSNSIGSPEDSAITTQLSQLTLQIERLQHELCETRAALCDQTRRANELERQIQEETRRRAATPTAQQVLRLKQQLAEMAEEAELLRRENEALRDDGAVGGYNDSAGNHRTESRYVRPATTRSQQISQALLRAASNAENNLRQLLTGVENLRRMAADIEDPALRLDYEGNSDVFPDFVDDYDGFEDFSGGPAL